MDNTDDFPILFYDGECGFCNHAVQFVLRHERKPEIHFAALQSSFAQTFFQRRLATVPDLSTLYYYDGAKFYMRSSAVLIMARKLKWYYFFLQVGWIFPKFFRDSCYNFIAKRRHRIAKGFCVLPDTDQKKRFL